MGPNGTVAEAGLQELLALEEKVAEYESTDSEAMVLVIRSYERVYESSLAMRNYENYQTDENFCLIADDLLESSRESMLKMNQDAGYANTAAVDYSEELGEYTATIQDLAVTFLGVSEFIEKEFIPLYQQLASSC